MDEAPMKSGLDVIYDGQCRFCERSLAALERLAGRRVFRLHDANDRALIRSKFPMLADADSDNAMFLVTPRSQLFLGFFAYRSMTWLGARRHALLQSA